MPVNSISPGQSAQAATLTKKTEISEARKDSLIQEANKAKDTKDIAERQAQIQKVQEASKPAVNSSGQTVGTRINVSA